MKIFMTKRWIAFAAATVPMLAAMGMGLRMLVNSVVFTLGIAIIFLLIPLAAIGMLALCLFSNWEGKTKAAVSLLLIACFVVTELFALFFTGFYQVKHYSGEEAWEQYSLRMETNPLLPEVDDLGEPWEISYHNVYTSAAGISAAETDWLICRYTPEKYDAQMVALESNGIFQSESINEWDWNCGPMVKLDGYQFRMAAVAYYSEEIFVIGHSQNTGEILYVCFWDEYLLRSDTSMQEIVNDYCGWKYIRRHCG